MKILVLGSEGVIGSALCNLAGASHEVIRVDWRIHYTHDLTNYENIDRLTDKFRDSDMIYFLAYNVGGSRFLERSRNDISVLRDNTTMMNNVFTIINRMNDAQDTRRKFIFASSQMSNMLHSSYGVSKALGERYTEALGGKVVRFWNVYGHEGREIGDRAHVITDFIRMALDDNVIKMRTSGTEMRQFLYNEDCAKALLHMSEHYDSYPFATDISSFRWVSILQIAQTVKEVIKDRTGKDVSIELGDKIDNVQLDKRNEPDLFIQTQGYWTPTTSLRRGINDCLDFYINSK